MFGGEIIGKCICKVVLGLSATACGLQTPSWWLDCPGWGVESPNMLGEFLGSETVVWLVGVTVGVAVAAWVLGVVLGYMRRWGGA